MEQEHLTKLAQILARRFSKEELRALCFNLGVDYDDLPAEGKVNKARELHVMFRGPKHAEKVNSGFRGVFPAFYRESQAKNGMVPWDVTHTRYLWAKA